MLCALWPLIPVGKSWWAIASCKLNLGIYLSFAPCLNVTVELNNYWDEPLRELAGFQALDVFIKMRLKAFLQVSIYAMYKLLGSLTDLKVSWAPLSGKYHLRDGFFFFFFGVFKTPVLWSLEAVKEEGWLPMRRLVSVGPCTCCQHLFGGSQPWHHQC